MKKILFAGCLAMMLSVSCSEGNSLTSMLNVLKAKWALQSLTGQSNLGSLFNDRLPFLQFDTENSKVTGNGGCNNLTGPFTLEKAGKLSFGNLAMTRMACPGNGESLFTSALQKVSNFSVKDNVLTLLNGKEELMKLVKAE